MKTKTFSTTLFLFILILSQAIQAQTKENVGINMSNVSSTGSTIPFIDVFKMCRPWVDFKTAPPVGTTFDTNGWPTFIPAGQELVSSIFTNIDGLFPKGTYVCLYEGEGSIEFTGNAVMGTSSAGRIEVNVITTNNGGITIKIKTTDPNNNGNYLRNIRLLMPGMESREDEIYNPAFLDIYKDFSTIRFMKWTLAEKLEPVTWNNRITPDYFSYANFESKGVPIESMIDICNIQQADMWFTMPPLADESYMINCAKLIKDSLHQSLKLYIEYSNETFNAAYPISSYATTEGAKTGITGSQWIAKKAVRMYAIFDSVFDSQKSTRLIKTLGFPFRPTKLSEVQSLLAYKPDGTNTFGSLLDAVSVAPYYGYTSTITNSSGGISDILTAQKWTVENIFEWLLAGVVGKTKYTNYDIFPEYHKTISSYKTEVDKYGKIFITYELGHHLASWGTTEPILTQTWQDSLMYEVYSLALQDWRKVNPDGVIVTFASASKGAFGLTPSDAVSEPMSYPKYKGVIDFINRETDTLRYHLKIYEGSLTGFYKAGTKISIKASSIAGKIFDAWTGDVSYLKNISDSINEITMPAKNISVTATYKDKPITLQQSNNTICVYPNPATDWVYVTFSEKTEGIINIINASGIVMMEENITSNKIMLNLSGLAKGMYVIKIITKESVCERIILVQ